MKTKKAIQWAVAAAVIIAAAAVWLGGVHYAAKLKAPVNANTTEEMPPANQTPTLSE